MNDLTCPWCEANLEIAAQEAAEQQCPECLTTWCYEEEADVDLPLAA